MKIAILGAGLMGRVLALRLYQSGYSNLTLIDKDTHSGENSPAFIAAGMLAPFSESVMGGHPIYQLGKHSLQLWQQYLNSLNSPLFLNNQGTLLLATPNCAGETQHFLDKISFNSYLSNDFYSYLTADAIATLEPELANFKQGYYLPHEGGLNARETFKALGTYLLTRVTWLTGIQLTSDHHQLELKLNNNLVKFDLIFDCRGVGAKNIFNSLRGVRGEVIRVWAPEVNLSRPVRLFHPRHTIYIMPYATNHYVIGASEIEAEDYSPISVRSTLELLSTAYTVHKGFAEARIVEAKANCRPALSNNLPSILVKDNYIAINGLYRHGFLLAPSLAENILTYLTTATKLNPDLWS